MISLFVVTSSARVDLNFTFQSINSLSFPLHLIPLILNMRIRNSQTSFLIPLVPQAVLRSTHFRSQFQYFDERFVVEEENRRIGWPYYPVRKHSSSDVQKVRPHDGLHSAIASEIKSSDFVEKKTGKENSMPAMQSHVINLPFLPAISPFMDLGSQKLEEPDKEGRTSNSSAASRRNVKGRRFSASVVLALSAPCTQPARGKKVYRKQKELPLKKRKKSRKLEIERTQAEKEEAATVKQDRTKEAFNKDDTSQVRTCINCVLNCESSLPHSRTYDSHGLQKEEDKLVETATLPNRKRGRPRKDSVHQSMATFGASPF